MSEFDQKLQKFQSDLVRLQFRSSRRNRFRIYRKLEGMLKTNEALSRALDRLYQNVTEMGKYPKKPAALALREWFLKDRMGITLSQAMDGWIPAGELYMIRAGEESGTLAKALNSIQEMSARSQEMKKAISSAVGYPIAMFILIGFVVYSFGINLIANMRANAPARVVGAMGAVVPFSDFISAWGLYIVAAIILICIIISVTLPYFDGPLRIKLDMYPPWSWYRIMQGSGFMLGMASLLGAQVPLKRSMEIMQEQGKPWFKRRVNDARQRVLRGSNLGEALRLSKMNFPDPIVAVDLEILSERADVGSVMEEVTKEWMREQVEAMQMQAILIRNMGMAIVGGLIAWVMSSIFAVVGELTKPGGS